MKNNPMEQYSEYRLQDTINNLEYFRNSIGWGQLSDDLGVAIECLEYMRDLIKREDTEEEKKFKKTAIPHWIIKDHGFAGKQLTCSWCEKGYWNSGEDPIEHCPHCKTLIDLDLTEYVK